MEAQVNHFSRGKHHTTPGKEEDIRILQSSYHTSKLHEFTPGRHLLSRDKVKDTIGSGSDPGKLKKIISRWADGRLSVRSTEQDWQDVPDNQVSENSPGAS